MSNVVQIAQKRANKTKKGQEAAQEGQEGLGNSGVEETRELIWVCSCGCSTFELLSSGLIRCPVCQSRAEQPQGGWYAPDPEQLWQGDPETGPIRDISGNGSEEFARALIVSRASRSDAVGIVVMEREGAVRVWTEAETEEQIAWFRDKLEVAHDLVRRGERQEGPGEG